MTAIDTFAFMRELAAAGYGSTITLVPDGAGRSFAREIAIWDIKRLSSPIPADRAPEIGERHHLTSYGVAVTIRGVADPDAAMLTTLDILAAHAGVPV